MERPGVSRTVTRVGIFNSGVFGLANIRKGGCARCNGKAKSGEALDECLCLHAEENALLEAGRERVGDGAVLYCNTYVINSLQEIFVVTDA